MLVLLYLLLLLYWYLLILLLFCWCMFVVVGYVLVFVWLFVLFVFMLSVCVYIYLFLVLSHFLCYKSTMMWKSSMIHTKSSMVHIMMHVWMWKHIIVRMMITKSKPIIVVHSIMVPVVVIAWWAWGVVYGRVQAWAHFLFNYYLLYKIIYFVKWLIGLSIIIGF